MARLKLSEYRSKKIVHTILGVPYEAWSLSSGDAIPSTIRDTQTYVVKVDQAIKQRFKKGLIFLDVPKKDLKKRITALEAKGFSSFLIEPFQKHGDQQERYISLRRERGGVVLNYSELGGVEIESHPESIQSAYVSDNDIQDVAGHTLLSPATIQSLIDTFEAQHLTFLEINPYVIVRDNPLILDIAIEVDSSSELLVSAWSQLDVRTPNTSLTDEEVRINMLKNESPASFSLEVMNPDGSIFLLLSGGGASVVIADEIFTLGHGELLANYGEYSGNPNEEETYIYTTQILSLLLKSQAKKKVLFIGGAVANFTDIPTTFKGVVAALRKYGDQLTEQGVKVYVRRGGPRQAQGLKLIQSVLKELNLFGAVYDPTTSIPDAVRSMIKEVE